MEFSLTGTPEIAPKLYWHNSANVLCNYMKKPEFLEIILKNQAIIPRYVIEPLEYRRTKKNCFSNDLLL